MTSLPRFLLAAALAAPLAAAPAAPALAQYDEVVRDVYGFQGSRLDIEVTTEAAGRIQLIRGRNSRIVVSGRAPEGFASSGLGGNGVRRLTLTSLGAEHVDFIVAVPEDVRVRVRWPGASRAALFGALAETASWAWDAPVERPAFETIGPRIDTGRDAAASGAPAAGRSVDGATPRLLDVRDAHRLERITLRIEGSAFRASADHDFTAERRDDRLLLAAPSAGDLTVFVPRGDSFTLSLDGRPAIAIERDDVRILCDSALAQVLPDGRRWFTITPAPGSGCGPAQEPVRGATPAGRRT